MSLPIAIIISPFSRIRYKQSTGQFGKHTYFIDKNFLFRQWNGTERRFVCQGNFDATRCGGVGYDSGCANRIAKITSLRTSMRNNSPNSTTRFRWRV